jgi:hypothetical protein
VPVVRIVPVEAEPSGVVATQGTQCFVGDQILGSVYKIELTAEVNDVWRAIIHCHPNFSEITALSDLVVKHQRPMWRRVLSWLRLG